jgi:trehalose/maltose hydrolase-like predicted phosphorylase
MRRAAVCFMLFLSIFPSQSLFAQDPSFVLTATSLEPYHASYLGNGYLSIATSRLGNGPEQSYMAGVYDQGIGDIPRIANLPAWNEINVSNGLRWLNDVPIDSEHIRSFHQVLNMYDGILNTSYHWVEGERHVRVSVQAFVSRNQRNCAVIRLTIQPQFSGRLKVSFPLQAWPTPARIPLAELDSVYYGTPGDWPVVWYPGHMTPTRSGLSVHDQRAILWLASESDGRKTQVAQAVNASWPANLGALKIDTVHGDTGVKIVVSFDASGGQRYTFSKYVAVYAGSESPSPLEDAIRSSSEACTRGYDLLFHEHAQAWHQLWETDIRIVGRPELQSVVHSMIFYLLCSVREGTDFGIPPMGLSTAGYYGHVFWDSDTWMFPPLVVTHPEIARSMVMFRCRTLDAALRNARQNGHHGAMYPWEADELGNETTPRFAHQNASYENHIVGDVALAQWQYFLATRDTGWLDHFGYDVLKETADFWASRATFDMKHDRYEIQNAVSVNEGLIGIPNDTYTNGICVKNLEIAKRASEILRHPANPLWQVIGSKLIIPYDSANLFHPVYEGAPASLGSVGLLLSYPLGLLLSNRVKRNDLEIALRLRTREGPGAMMTETLFPLAAAELGDQDLLDSLVRGSYEPFLKPPFNVMSETPQNISIIFLTGAGGFLQQVIFGYTGLRLAEDGLVRAYKPVLPKGVSSLLLKNFSVQGHKYDIEVIRDTVIFHPR